MVVESFKVRCERTETMRWVTPHGELDVATAPVLERELEAVPGDEDTMLVLDLTELAFIDSSGINLLLRLNERFAERLRVINGSPAVERLFDITGVRPLLPIIAPDDDPLAPLR